ncbi:Xaa-Pro peptidase family protein [Desulforhopalus sp. IMCC35007]|uniref:M24 family metallopeptidase n=1 Tax=Desulforhopalus sp. IMCC35007 TaxID=2569543 RepID=UPI0010ADB3A0|nr:Xaa-Pro peptidase family protein [Desulforhopalus sp. IMCC35007]TKB07604.1 aminopeptidase P family protein [Desulforhopalus sp. IMCC35007]
MRREKLTRFMDEHALAAIAVNAGPSLTYLTGLHFHLMERPVVIVFPCEGKPVIILPQLEKTKLNQLQFDAEVFSYGENPDSWRQVFCEALQDMNLGKQKIGIEPRQLRVLEYELLKQAVAADFVDGTPVLAALRAVKGEEEIACMQKAVKIAEDALEATLPLVKVGVDEKEIASELFLQLMRYGSENSLPFSPIVAAGPNGANPHSTPSSRKFMNGDLLIIDWGACWNGYASDLTRTFGIGDTGATEKEIYGLVHRANRAGRLAGGVGVACEEVDRQTREVIEKGGYGQYFTHRTGHGIGLECHEDPYMRQGNGQLLEVGMTYTVEPGIYLPGQNGVRIEDDVLITAQGPVSLSTMTRELRQLG